MWIVPADLDLSTCHDCPATTANIDSLPQLWLSPPPLQVWRALAKLKEGLSYLGSAFPRAQPGEFQWAACSFLCGLLGGQNGHGVETGQLCVPLLQGKALTCFLERSPGCCLSLSQHRAPHGFSPPVQSPLLLIRGIHSRLCLGKFYGFMLQKSHSNRIKHSNEAKIKVHEACFGAILRPLSVWIPKKKYFSPLTLYKNCLCLRSHKSSWSECYLKSLQRGQ